MALTQERRNEIAWKFFVHRLRNRGKMYSVKETCEYFSKEYKVSNGELLRIAIESAYFEIMFPSQLIEDSKGLLLRNEFAWIIHILYEYRRGIKIGENFCRDIGNKAIEISEDPGEVYEYYIELAAEVMGILSNSSAILSRISEFS